MDQPVRNEILNEDEKFYHKPGFSGRQTRILVAPLDWGLGHATRCIPVIRELINQGCDVYLCGEGAQEALLKKEFPTLPFLSLPGYRVIYGTSGLSMTGKIFFQAPRIMKLIRQENKWLKKIAAELALDGVISDNRFGLFHKTIPGIFITHQLRIKTRLGKWIDDWVQKRNYRYINKYTECWVPDAAKEFALAGELSHPKKFPKTPVKYIGILSRFERTESILKPGHLVVILSGPEPQRSLMENKIIGEIGNYAATATIVRGLPASENIIPSTNMIRFYNHLPSEELNREISAAEFVISRSGYSTVMDLFKLNKKSILIPTPGQPEQEWLGKWLDEKKMALVIRQNKFSLSSALQAARRFDYHLPSVEIPSSLGSAVSGFIKKLTIRKN